MNIKKMVLLLLAAAMLSFVLTSCGKSSANDPEKTSAESGIVWRGERTYIDGITADGSISRADNFLYNDGRVYFRTEEYPDGMENPDGNRIVITVHSVNTDGSGLVSVPIADGKNEYFGCFALDGNGNIVLMETVSDEGGSLENVQYFLKTFSPEGNEISSVNITEAVDSFKSEYFYDGSIALDGSGNIYIGNYYYIAAFSPEGKLIFGKDTGGSGGIYKLVTSASGDVYGSVYMDGYVLKKIDPVTGELGENIKLSNSQYSYTSVPYSGAGETEIYVDDGTALTGLDPENGEITEILNWVDSDLIRSEIGGVFFDENSGGFICPGLSYPGNSPVVTVITPRNASELPSRTEIIMAGSEFAVNFPLEYQAVKFNMENENYRIKIKKYTGDDYITRLNSDIISGNIPDILITDSQMNLQSYISKGLFCDMYEFIDSDSELARSDLLPNVLSAFETEGKLYNFTSSFMISTVIGKASIFKESGIDFERLAEIRESFPEENPGDTEIFSGMDKNAVLQYGLRMSADSFIDYKTGECRFDSEEFMKLLEFANTFPSSAELNFDNGFWQRLDTMYFDESVLLMMPMISCYGDYFCYEHGYFGDVVTAVGFPSVSGEPGSAIFINNGFAISAKPGNSEGAWQFVRTLLLPEFQNETENFPVRISALENMAKKEMNASDSDSYSAIITMGDWSLASTKFVSEIGKPAQEDIDRINALVTSVSRLELYNSTIREIVNEEASAYFAGSKSAKETSEMIQSRVKLYLTENS